MWFDEYKEVLMEQIEKVVREAAFTGEEFRLVDIAFYGSRTTGRANEESDLDVLVEYEGLAREDVMFDLLAESELELEGIRLDINPIKADKSGTISEYLERCDDNWKEQLITPRRRSR